MKKIRLAAACVAVCFSVVSAFAAETASSAATAPAASASSSVPAPSAASSSSAPAEESLSVTKEQVMSLINQFKKEKDFSGKSLMKYNDVLTYASKSHDVQVNITEKSNPWFANEKVKPYSTVLLLSYICGNLENQLKQNVKKNMPYEGDKFVFDTYAKIKKQDKSFVIDEIEFYIQKEKKHTLQMYLADEER